ncbi:hypothetical protein D910_01912 [Dendroctonus ponderosae]|uniref:Uncharacterized protein n=1 Tax=Dendroctonus ponderosae TaxID=77166 RepID=U4U1K7_DENPD|nr:hypothetical protein D910_01912 [Dendroctonus ponderosae]
MIIFPSLQPDANLLLSGDQAMQSTQFLCPVPVNLGVCVSTSQNRTVVSPDPLAKYLPSGEKVTEITASAWPGIDAVHRVTGLTRKTACC